MQKSKVQNFIMKPYSSQSEEDYKSANKQFEEMAPDDKKSFSELKQQYRVAEGNQVEHMNNQAYYLMYKGLKTRQIKFYGFLNKEFNIINYKSARCALHWFDDINQSVFDANAWVQIWREGLKNCKIFAEGLQNKAEDENKQCKLQAQEITFKSDPIMHWISWYEKLIRKLTPSNHR